MNKDKQIEEMAQIIALKAFEQAHLIDGDENLADIVATDLYEKGYRRASEVAREIFEELEKFMSPYRYPIIADLKKKYNGEDTNVTTKYTEGEG